ncbi:UDP-N-acetylmuramate dehydrogenase [Dongia deserti]|uniref:UDP-N-acetylmuramate dehydrogenase n=1 Tax=Dongia deserti TaxID=2268030 RepID=UPI0025496CA9|nr:UDP-N-acetylmuramate dehydrogenase [Dongia deserti]
MAVADTPLIDRLPQVRGRLSAGSALSAVTWFRVGGPADVLFRPADVEDLAHFLKHKPNDVPVMVIGVGSNLLVRDGGIEGVVIRLGRGFTDIRANGTTIEAGAGALDLNAALSARDAGIGGLEFLSGIPGTIGGALRMNAGAYECDVSQIFQHADALDAKGTLHRLGKAEMGFTYRHCAVPEDWIFVAGAFTGHADDPKAIHARIQEIQTKREETQPIRSRTGGSTFVNPTGHKAWKLIDEAGCRGLRKGGAIVSEKHCNFLINTGDANAADIESLGEEVRRRVRDRSGVELAWEIKRIGRPAARARIANGEEE